MNNKLIIGVIIIAIVLGGGYFVVKAAKHGMTSTPAMSQQETHPTVATSSPSIMQSQTTVTLTQSSWSPATLTIKAGQTVRWINKSGQDATVNSNPHPTHTDYSPLNLGSFSDGQSLSLTFPKAGTYGYHNHLNSNETGTIIVQ